jgi:sugar phosphate permease
MLANLYLRDPPLPVLGALLFLNGVFSGAMTNCFAAIREHNPGPAVGVAFAMVNTANVASAALLQPFIGYLLDLNWDGTQVAGARIYDLAAYDAALAIFPLSFALALGAALMVRETFCRPVDLA